MSARRRLPVLLFTLVFAPACGKAGQDAPQVADTGIAADPIPPEDGEPEVPFVAVELPADFPADFPIAPASTVVSASSRSGEGGAYSEVTIASRGEPDDSYDWYRRALIDAGWRISNEGQTDRTRTLHATLGESTVDLSVAPHPERADGWVQVEAAIWKVGT